MSVYFPQNTILTFGAGWGGSWVCSVLHLPLQAQLCPLTAHRPHPLPSLTSSWALAAPLSSDLINVRNEENHMWLTVINEKGTQTALFLRALPSNVRQIHAFSCMQVKTENSLSVALLTSVIKPTTSYCKLISYLFSAIPVFFVQFDREAWYTDSDNNNNNYNSPKWREQRLHDSQRKSCLRQSPHLYTLWLI